MRGIVAGVSVRLGAVVVASWLAFATTMFTSGEARAEDPKVTIAKDKIKESDPKNDVTLRTGAALTLGASNDDAAADPLCAALSDSNEVVRQAVAVALKRLNRTRTLGCLKDRVDIEKNDAARIAMTRAIEAISSNGDGGGADDPIKQNPSAKYYISLSSVANSTGRSQTEVEKIVLKSIRAKLDSAGVHQLAPSSETADKAREVMKGRKMKGFYLAIAVDQFDYRDGNLKVKVKIGVFNYPNKSLLGNVDKTLTAPGIGSKDKDAEDRLMELAAGLASEQFSQNASAFL
jgi:hypothetical protein